jgi:hypothetical protein
VYVTFSFSPVLGESGKVDGIHCACTEVTENSWPAAARDPPQTRRPASEGRSVEEACREAVRVLGENRQDVPFAAVYAFAPRRRKPGSSPPWAFRRERSSSLRRGRAFAVADRRRAPEPPRGRSGRPPGPRPRNRRGPWPEACRRAVVLPIPGATPETPAGVLVAGVGARRPYNAAYRTFFGLVAGQLGTAISDAKAYEGERRRAEALAELDRAKTRVLLEREPRVPHSAHAHPGSRAGCARPPRPVPRGREPRGGPPEQRAPPQAGQLAPGFLADRGGEGPGLLSADGPLGPDAAPRDVSSNPPPSAPDSRSRSTAPRSARTCTSIGTCGRRSF